MGVLFLGGSGSSGPTVVLLDVTYSLFPVNLNSIGYGE